MTGADGRPRQLSKEPASIGAEGAQCAHDAHPRRCASAAPSDPLRQRSPRARSRRARAHRRRAQPAGVPRARRGGVGPLRSLSRPRRCGGRLAVRRGREGNRPGAHERDLSSWPEALPGARAYRGDRPPPRLRLRSRGRAGPRRCCGPQGARGAPRAEGPGRPGRERRARARPRCADHHRGLRDRRERHSAVSRSRQRSVRHRLRPAGGPRTLSPRRARGPGHRAGARRSRHIGAGVRRRARDCAGRRGGRRDLRP